MRWVTIENHGSHSAESPSSHTSFRWYRPPTVSPNAVLSIETLLLVYRPKRVGWNIAGASSVEALAAAVTGVAAGHSHASYAAPVAAQCCTPLVPPGHAQLTCWPGMHAA